jgi:hypothetical protein
MQAAGLRQLLEQVYVGQASGQVGLLLQEAAKQHLAAGGGGAAAGGRSRAAPVPAGPPGAVHGDTPGVPCPAQMPLGQLSEAVASALDAAAAASTVRAQSTASEAASTRSDTPKV